MTKPLINSNLSKSKGRVILEYILFAVCLCVIALRTTLVESPTMQSSTLPANLTGSVYGLTISAGLFFAFVVWFIWGFCSKRFLYRFTGIEAGLCIFVIAAIAAGLAAANTRAAITNIVCLVTPPLCAILLVQILDSQSKIKLLLAVIAALGVLSAYQCAEQFFVSNQMTIEQYQQAPETMLGPLGIRPGTFKHMLFEHRLYSRGVHGFFTTSNSAGSFALLASFAAVALFIQKFKNRKSNSARSLHLLTCGIAVAAVLCGLAITRSKGAITASLIAAAMFAIYLFFGNWLKKHKKVVFIVCLFAVIAGGCAAVCYGLTHGRLPGGNSMLVRWQYWTGAAKMYADHSLTGIGPANFTHFYPYYKPAGALESVADPHNFLLSILTQYGPLGLAGFLLMIFVPLWRATSSSSAGEPRVPPIANGLGRVTGHEPRGYEPAFKKLAIPFVIVISAALLLIRPIIMSVTIGDTLGVMIYVILTLYVTPVVVFAVGFWLLTVNGKPARPTGAYITVAALSCAVLGLLVHNLIDFAIFEPGVFTALWVIIASLIALDFHRKSRTQFVLKPAPFVRMLVVAAGLVMIGAYFYYAWWPVKKSIAKIQQAHQAVSNGQLQQAHNLFAAAAKDDCLSPAASSLNGRLYLYHFRVTGESKQDLLAGAKDNLLEAINRNRADFKNFEQLAEVYNLLAGTQPRMKNDWLNYAFDNALLAVERYPGSGRLRIKLAKTAEQLGKTDIAIENYKKAVEIEDAYRAQFQQMYPGRQIFSRLGEEKYKNAKQRIKHLSEQ